MPTCTFCWIPTHQISRELHVVSVRLSWQQCNKWEIEVKHHYIKDIYFFEVNRVLKASEFSRVRSTSGNCDVFNSQDELCLVFTAKMYRIAVNFAKTRVGTKKICPAPKCCIFK